MKSYALEVGLVAALCALSASSALAQFTNFQESPWQGGVNHFYGNTLITSAGTFNNSGALIYDTSTLPGDTGPLFGWDLTPGVTRSGDYYLGVGMLVEVSGGTNTINNNPGGTMQAVVTGSGQAFGVGLYAEENAVTIKNWGTMDGEVQNNDGTAAGVYATGNVTMTNNVGATLSATAPYYAGGIYSAGGGAQYIVNNGTIVATATGAIQGTNANQAYAAGIDVFTYDPSDMSPIFVVNNGSIMVSCTGGATNIAHCGAMWDDQNDITWINNGTMTATMTGSSGDASGIYFGANNADVTFINTGTINNSGGPGGEGVWMENDGTTGDMHFYNSGTIASGAPFALAIAAYSSGPWGTAYVTNTGTISGGWFGLGWPGNIILVDSGDIRTGLAWLGGASNVNVYISGLPTIQPTLGAGSGSNTLVFNLTGTLQQVNGNAASGNDLSAFNLGSLGSGSIVVSGKTYRWSNFTNVSGAITAATTLLAGPTNLTATVASSNQANLAWNAVAGAAGYNVKRSVTSGGPYTTMASGVAATNYTDSAAYISLEYYYVVSAMAGGVETANSAEVALRHPRLTGAIIGTAGSWSNDGDTIAKVFDNNLTTFFDGPDATGDWVGLDFGASVSNVITLINYCPRQGSESRMVGGIFQGANEANFSDAVTLFTVASQPASGVFTPASITNTLAFRYVRYLSATNGFCNVAELQFYGNLAGAPVPRPPAPGLAATAVSSNQINLAWTGVTNAASYNVKRSTTNGGPYVIIATGWTMTNYTDVSVAGATTYFYVVSAVNAGGESSNSVQASATTLLAAGLTATAISANQISLTWNAISNAASYNVKRSAVSGGPYAPIASGVTATNYVDIGLPVSGGWYYVVSAMVGGRETPNSAEAALSFPKLTGGIIGTAGSWNNSGNTIANVFDNNLTTFFDAPGGNGDWVGLDFGIGVSNVIAQINYCPRAGFEARMTNGIFQGANRADFSDAVTLFTVTTQPAAGGFTSVGVTDTNAFRYVFYLSPNGGFGNVAELQFHGYPLKPPQPRIVGVSIAGGNLVFSGTNGLAAGAYAIWSSTNLATPLSNWVQAGSGYFNGNGNFSITNLINSNETQQFFMLRQP
jgi:fibronectin type 3 domain-containing protein